MIERKQGIRRSAAAALRGVDRKQRGLLSDAIARRVLESRWWREADTVLTYLSFGREVVTDCLVAAAREAGKGIGAPRISAGDMDFFPIGTEPFVLNGMGIREPASPDPILGNPGSAGKNVLAIVPGLAFDREMNRLGRGGGYYDRWLGRARSDQGMRLTALAICFGVQLLDRVPHGPRDEPVDVIVTEREILS